jgi:hypothetical protein
MYLDSCKPATKASLGRAAAEHAEEWHRLLLRTRPHRPWRYPAEQRDELAPSHVGHGASPPQPVCRTLSLPQSGRQVVRSSLNCSESKYDRPAPNAPDLTKNGTSRWANSDHPDVRIGSLADIPRCPSHVRYYTESRHCPRVYEYTP